MSSQKKTHNIARITITDHTGTHDGGKVYVHKSRACSNCAHDGLRDAEWVAEGGVEKFGRCMNMCSAGDFEDASSNWCHDHQTDAEFEANVHRPRVPVFIVVQGGAK